MGTAKDLMSNFDPKKFIQQYDPTAPPPEEPSFLDEVGEGASALGRGLLENVVAPVGRFIDRYSGAPTREAISRTTQEGGGLLEGAKGFYEQFGEDPELAPTGKELAQRAGLSERTASEVFPGLYSETGDEWLKFQRGGLLDPTASGAAGLGIDILADPTNVLPGGLLLKSAGKGAKEAAKLGAKAAKSGVKAAARGADLATGTKVGTGLLEGASTTKDIVSDIGSGIRQSVSEKTTKAVPLKKTYAKDLETAQKLGLGKDDLTSAIEYGDVSVPSRLEKSVMGSPQGQDLLLKRENLLDKVNEGVENLVTSKGEVYRTADEAGEFLKETYSSQLNKLFEDNALTYRKAADLTPNMQLTEGSIKKLDSIGDSLIKRGRGLAARGFGDRKKVGNYLIELGEKLKVERNYRQLADEIASIGEEASSAGIDSAGRTLRKELNKTYKGVSDALIETVSDLHPDLGKQLVQNNKNYSRFFRARDNIGKAIQDEMSRPGTVFKTITGNPKKIEQLKEILDPEQFNTLRASYLNSLIKRNAGGEVTFGSSLKNLRENKAKLDLLFDPKEIEEIRDVLELGSRTGFDSISSARTDVGLNFQRPNLKSEAGPAANRAVLNRIRKESGLLKDDFVAPRPDDLVEATIDTEGASRGLLGQRRGPIERRLKGAQSVAPSLYDRERR